MKRLFTPFSAHRRATARTKETLSHAASRHFLRACADRALGMVGQLISSCWRAGKCAKNWMSGNKQSKPNNRKRHPVVEVKHWNDVSEQPPLRISQSLFNSRRQNWPKTFFVHRFHRFLFFLEFVLFVLVVLCWSCDSLFVFYLFLFLFFVMFLFMFVFRLLSLFLFLFTCFLVVVLSCLCSSR